MEITVVFTERVKAESKSEAIEKEKASFLQEYNIELEDKEIEFVS